ncbi:hypothetical protein [uncultured Sunxiuqinia sp.]|nr:hypothetical protein [uncultured Sunxiuqinia sp.]
MPERKDLRLVKQASEMRDKLKRTAPLFGPSGKVEQAGVNLKSGG